MSKKDIETFGAIVDVMDVGTMTPKHREAFELCAEVYNRLQAKAKEKPTGRRAAIEYTKRKISDEQNKNRQD